MVAFSLSYHPLHTTAFKPTTTNSAKRNLDGEVVVCSTDGPGRLTGQHTFKFWWATYSQLQNLVDLAHSGESFTISTAEGDSYTVMFVGDNPINASPTIGEQFSIHADIDGKPFDLYDGEITVVIL
jgi:hypothetical protein